MGSRGGDMGAKRPSPLSPSTIFVATGAGGPCTGEEVEMLAPDTSLMSTSESEKCDEGDERESGEPKTRGEDDESEEVEAAACFAAEVACFETKLGKEAAAIAAIAAASAGERSLVSAGTEELTSGVLVESLLVVVERNLDTSERVAM